LIFDIYSSNFRLPYSVSDTPPVKIESSRGRDGGVNLGALGGGGGNLAHDLLVELEHIGTLDELDIDASSSSNSGLGIKLSNSSSSGRSSIVVVNEHIV